MFRNNYFEGKRVLITGAGRGIGKTVSLLFAEYGASIIAVSRSAGPLGILKETIQKNAAKKNGAKHAFITADVVTETGVDKMCSALNETGLADIVIANAHARVPEVPAWKLESGHRISDLALNNRYLLDLFGLLLPYQKKQGFGRWVAVSSYAHVVGIRGKAIYNAQKAALEAIMRTLANEQAQYGITANSVLPGYIDTPETQSHSETIRHHLSQANPMGRAGRPEEVAQTICFLASPAASFINGESLAVTGGGHLAGSITKSATFTIQNAQPVQG